jgi:hypothetical protein
MKEAMVEPGLVAWSTLASAVKYLRIKGDKIPNDVVCGCCDIIELAGSLKG